LSNKSPKRPRRPVHGLYPKNFPRSVKWKVDQDYLDRLTDEEREWLSQFNDHYYGAKFPKDRSLTTWDADERRQAYRDKNVANADYYAKCPPELVIPWNPGAFATTRGQSGDLDNADDSYVRSLADESLWVDPCVHPQPDYSPAPAYLEREEYKTARTEFRKHLNQTRRELMPEPTEELTNAWLELEFQKDLPDVEDPETED
jgi:hypothetical protein